MMCAFGRWFWITCLVISCAPRVVAQVGAARIDPTAEALAKVQAGYEMNLAALGEELLNKLDAELDKERAKAPPERDLEITQRRIAYLEKDREALLERGEWPTSISVAEIRYHWGNDQRAKLREAYRSAAAAAAQRGDAEAKQKLEDELASFDRTNDLAPWQDLAAWVDLGQGEQAWNRVGDLFTCPAKGAAGGARNPLRFRRALPTEYTVRFNIRWIEGEGGLILGLLDSRGQQFDLALPRPVLPHREGRSIGGEKPVPGGDVMRVGVHVERDRITVAADGRALRWWTEGQPFPAETDPPGAYGPELFLGSNDANTRLKVLSAELKCSTRVSTAPTAIESRGASQAVPPTGPPQAAVRHDKPAVIAALVHALDWLIRHQDKEGGWSLERYMDVCPELKPCLEPGHVYSTEYDPGVTGLATLALLRAREQLSKTVNKDPIDLPRIDAAARAAVSSLIHRQKPNGSFSAGKSFVYNEALCTLALAEAYGQTKDRDWKEPAQRAADFLMRAQRPSPKGSTGPEDSGGLWGWRYAPRMDVEDPRKSTGNVDYEKDVHDSDTSATGWAVMALRSAEKAGLDVHKENMDGAFAFAKHVTGDDGKVGYLDRLSAGQIITGKNDHYVYHPAVMSALGLCIRLYTRHMSSQGFFDPAAQRIVADPPSVSRDKLSVDYYYWYCGTVALDQLDGPDSSSRNGKYWNPWNKALVEALMPLQDKADQACSNGAWLIPDRWSFTGGPIYATAINALTLEDALGWK